MTDGNTLAHQKIKDRGRPITFTSQGKPLSYAYDEYWDLSGMGKSALGRKGKIAFSDKSDLIPEYKRKIQEVMAGWVARDRRDGVEPNYEKLNNIKNALCKITSALGSDVWSDIDCEKNWNAFKREIKKQRFSKGVIETIISVINKLRLLGFIRRFGFENELHECAIIAARKQHIAIPMGMYRQLISKSIEVLELYHPHRYEIARVMEEAYDIQDRIQSGERLCFGAGARVNRPLSMDKRALGPRVTKNLKLHISHNIPNFSVTIKGEELNSILRSCLIITEAFSGVRLGECLSFNLKSYEQKETESGKVIAVLLGETTKSNGGVPKRETWQSHLIVKDALELAQIITEPLRKRYKVKIEEKRKCGEYNQDHYDHAKREVESVFLTPKYGMQKTSYVMTGTPRNIWGQIKSWGICASEEDVEEFELLNPSWEGELKVGGYLPKLRNHDLRRSFAVFYKRYGFGNESGIKFQYKHRNINMSGYYAANAELAAMNDILLDQDLLQIMKKEGINLGVDIYNDIYNKSEHLSGGGGEIIASEKLERAKAGHDAYMTRSEIEGLVKNGIIGVVQLPTGGYCTNRNCERLCDFGMFTVGNNSCGHKVITDKEARKKAQQRLRAIETFKGLNTGDSLRISMLVGIKRKIKDIEVTLSHHKIEYVPFNDEIEGVDYAKQA
jgi:hypothetical protein